MATIAAKFLTPMPATPRHRNLPRLSREHYQGEAYVHWTLGIQERGQGWLSPLFHARFREIMTHTQQRYAFSCPIYCLMPDHCHLLWIGLNQNTNQVVAMEFLRKHLRPHLNPFRWQSQAYEHILREKERERNAFQSTAHYILENPVRAGLVGKANDYEFSGAVVAGYPDLDPFRNDYWEKFWRIHELLRKQT